MARMGLTKGERITLKNRSGTATLFFPMVLDGLSMIGPHIMIMALSATAQSLIQQQTGGRASYHLCGIN